MRKSETPPRKFTTISVSVATRDKLARAALEIAEVAMSFNTAVEVVLANNRHLRERIAQLEGERVARTSASMKVH